MYKAMKVTRQAYRVLIVDDEKETRNLILAYLKDKGFQVVAIKDGKSALDLMKVQTFDIAIVDLYMPEMNGIELLRELKKLSEDLQVVMVTAYGTIKDAVECMKLGASDFITKPVLLDHLYITIRRIMEEKRLKEEAELANYYKNLSHLDDLTGLYNFRYLMIVLKKEAKRHIRYNHTLTLAMLDLDNFKEYNDTRGHEAGNELLVNIAHIFRHNTRNCDMIFRYGGEEFIIVFPETTQEEAEVVAQRIRVMVEASLDTTITIGLASLPKDTTSSKELIDLADKAMYWGKAHGKNQVVIYNEPMSMCR